MNHPPYPNYTTTDNQWLRTLPSHWGYAELRRYITFITSGSRGWAEHYSDEGSLFIRIGNLTRTTIRLDLSDVQYVTPPDNEEAVRTRVQVDDVLFSITAYLGSVAVAEESAAGGYINQHIALVRLQSRKAVPRYIAYATLADFGQAQLSGQGYGGTKIQLALDDVKSLWMPVPPVDEQIRIAKFLDQRTAAIDTLISKKQALVERLKEKRTALISRTVTRGLPPDAARAAGLDSNPKLKPSGIDWLGDVPEPWEVRKFSREVWIAEGQVDPEVEPYASMLLVAPNHIESGTGRLLLRETAAEQAAISGKYQCRKGEVIYSKIRPALAKVTIAPEDCLCSADMYPMTSTGRLNNRYLAWLLLSQEFTAWSVLEADRVAMPKINRETLSELRLPIPPMAEQLAIAEYLDKGTASIDAMATKVDLAIKRLTEYRTALITAAVTGKIDVRGVVA